MKSEILRHPKAEEAPALRALWSACFPEDADGFCDFFLNEWFRPERCLVIADGNELQSMVHLFTAEQLEYGKVCGRYLYLYAVGTAPQFRRKGNLGRLLQGCRELAKAEGYAGILLTSAEGLEPLYEHYGMTPCAVRYETYFAPRKAAPILWESCVYDRYARLRSEYLRTLPAAFGWEADTDRFIYDVMADSDSVKYWQENGQEFYAITGCEDGTPTLSETNHPLDEQFLLRAAAAMGTDSELKICSPTPIHSRSRAVCFGHRICIAENTLPVSAYLNLIAD